LKRDNEVITLDLSGLRHAVVYPLADVHLGSEDADVEAFERLVEEIRQDASAYVVLAGDLIDNGLKSSVTNVYRQTMRPAEQKREMARMLSPIRDKIACILPGNHCGRSSKESDDCPAYDIASKLDLEDLYRENAAFIRVFVGKDTSYQRPYRYFVGVLHGSGGGMYAGSTVNKVDNFMQSIEGLDVIITAHAHKPYALRGSKLECDYGRNVMRQRPTLEMCAGSWLHYAGYPVRKMLRPVAMPGANKLLLYGDKYRFEAVV
jgi:DNA repair exonuclease SbcCD nuclease subunit